MTFKIAEGNSSCRNISQLQLLRYEDILNFLWMILRFGCRLDDTNIVNVSLWALGHCDDISHFFLNFYEPNNQSINGADMKTIQNKPHLNQLQQ